jgi:uracil-DNA glycosylase family 4
MGETGKKRPFMGHAGAEFNRNYLPMAGLDRDDIYFTNTVKCRLTEDNDKPSQAEVDACASHHLPEEIGEINPQVIVLMGATATSLIPSIEVEKQHGIPFYCNAGDSAYFGDWAGWVVPMLHPQSGMHDTSQMIPLIDDFERLRQWLAGRWNPPVAPELGKYELVETTAELERILATPALYAAVDTEDDGPRPWSIQVSTRPGHAFMVMADGEPMEYLRRWFAEFQGFVIMHNAAHDLDVMDKMGIRVNKFRDTLQEAYHLTMKQGLKTLSFRTLGVRMTSWEDTVLPYSRAKMKDWLVDAWDVAGEHLKIRVEKQLKTKVKVEYKPSKCERDLKRIISNSHKPEYDLWEKVAECEIVKALGDLVPPHPIKSIANTPLDVAVLYSCLDADITGQVALELEKMRTELVETKWLVNEGDWDQ